MTDWLFRLCDRLLTDADDRIVAQQKQATIAAGGTDAAAAFLELCRLAGEAADPAAALIALDEVEDAEPVDLLGLLVIHAFADLRASYPAQPDASAARERLALRAEAAYPAIGDMLGHAVLDFTVRMVGEATVQLSRLAANAAPLVRVETGISLPSSLIAFDLYGQASRGAEIMERNRCGTPMMLPSPLKALAY
ncbi:MAG TPA: hypothetical protein VGV39_00305 [Mesorhizobium sp.]|jgi:hypothetical protein|uniref:hypothetical protein n=1 Tax=Mesorhizobium sp. TaxID=1871066 RepID=UPI002DDD8A74|nr:hypothetical protein [Mesorhizobium sp.]HEV2501482.1 hypothetical protein [Mesorhizobium sp.]